MNDFEEGLHEKICERIKLRGYCVLYNHDLTRVCPPEEALRKKQIQAIRKFAAKNMVSISIREIGINATFKKSQELGTPLEHSDTSTVNSLADREPVSRRLGEIRAASNRWTLRCG